MDATYSTHLIDTGVLCVASREKEGEKVALVYVSEGFWKQSRVHKDLRENSFENDEESRANG